MAIWVGFIFLIIGTCLVYLAVIANGNEKRVWTAQEIDRIIPKPKLFNIDKWKL